MRECAGCRVCCTATSIPEIEKPAWTPCPSECEAGCSRYADRPQVCVDYRCLWLKGELPEWAWPGRTGLMVSSDDPALPVVNVLGLPGAEASYWGHRLVTWLARERVVSFQGRRIATRRANEKLLAYLRVMRVM